MQSKTINPGTSTTVSYPGLISCFAPSIITIYQANHDLIDVTLSVGSTWSETRTPVNQGSWSVVRFDLQPVARAVMRATDMFGSMSTTDGEDLLHKVITFNLSTRVSSSLTYSTDLSIQSFYGSYTIGDRITPDVEHIYYPYISGLTIPKVINVPMSFDGAPPYVEAYDSTGALISSGDLPAYYYNLTLSTSKLIFEDVIELNNVCSNYLIDPVIQIEHVAVTGDLFRFINSSGMIRYVGFDFLSSGSTTKSSSNLAYDTFEQNIESNNAFKNNNVRISETSFFKNLKASNISDDFLPQYEEFLRSSFIQIAQKDSNSDTSITWKSVIISDATITRKRRENLTDVNVSITLNTEQNSF